MDQSLSPKPEEKAANADQTPDAQPVPDEVAASEHEEAEQSPYEDQSSINNNNNSLDRHSASYLNLPG